MRATLDHLLQAAFDVLETGNWPEASAERREADVEAFLHTCIVGLEARGCAVEVSPYPSWEADAPALDMDYDGVLNRENRHAWVFSGLDQDAQLMTLLHEAAHFLDTPERANNQDEEQAKRELVAYMAASAASLELGFLGEDGAIEEVAGGLAEAALWKNGWKWRPALQEVPGYIRPLLGEALLNKAARIAEELVGMLREDLERREKGRG